MRGNHGGRVCSQTGPEKYHTAGSFASGSFVLEVVGSPLDPSSSSAGSRSRTKFPCSLLNNSNEIQYMEKNTSWATGRRNLFTVSNSKQVSHGVFFFFPPELLVRPSYGLLISITHFALKERKEMVTSIPFFKIDYYIVFGQRVESEIKKINPCLAIPINFPFSFIVLLGPRREVWPSRKPVFSGLIHC